MPQFYLPPGAVLEKTFHLSGPEAFHIAKVLRYREGQSLLLFDGKGGRCEGGMAATIGFLSECEPVIALADDHTRFWPTRLAPRRWLCVAT